MLRCVWSTLADVSSRRLTCRLADVSSRRLPALIPEPLIWSYVIQLTGALRLVHSSGLACRVLDPSKILVSWIT